MTPTDFLTRAAALMDERPELRPTVELRPGETWRLRLGGREPLLARDDPQFGPVVTSFWPSEAVNTIVAFWAEKVAEAGYWIDRRIGEERTYWQVTLVGPDNTFFAETQTYLAALLAGVEGMPKPGKT